VAKVHIRETGEDWPAEIKWRGRTFKLTNALGVLEYRVASRWVGNFRVATTSGRPPPARKGAQVAPRTWNATVGRGLAEGYKSPRKALHAAWRAHLQQQRENERTLANTRKFTRAFEGSD